MSALLKTALYLGTVLLLGAGVFRLVIGPELARTMRRSLRVGAVLGAVLIISVSLADVGWTVFRLVARFDPALTLEYLLTTRHGQATLLRLALTIPLALLVLTERRRSSGPLFAVTSLGVLVTFSYLSHAAVQHGAAALLTDLGHVTAAALWGGAVLYTALSPAWGDPAQREALTRAAGRVSSTGLGSVLLLTATGVYASVLHLEAPAMLATTPYGRLLSLKLVLVAVILGLAAFNRWVYLPALTQRGATRGFARVMRLEALLLLTVFAATGLLTTSPLPHE